MCALRVGSIPGTGDFCCFYFIFFFMMIMVERLAAAQASTKRGRRRAGMSAANVDYKCNLVTFRSNQIHVSRSKALSHYRCYLVRCKGLGTMSALCQSQCLHCCRGYISTPGASSDRILLFWIGLN